jgi:hypothetical protein
MPGDDRHHDPMRELDLLLLEEMMMRRNFQPTRTATALQTMSMLLVLLGVGVIFAYALRNPDAGTAATSRLGDASSTISPRHRIP